MNVTREIYTSLGRTHTHTDTYTLISSVGTIYIFFLLMWIVCNFYSHFHVTLTNNKLFCFFFWMNLSFDRLIFSSFSQNCGVKFLNSQAEFPIRLHGHRHKQTWGQPSPETGTEFVPSHHQSPVRDTRTHFLCLSVARSDWWTTFRRRWRLFGSVIRRSEWTWRMCHIIY